MFFFVPLMHEIQPHVYVLYCTLCIDYNMKHVVKDTLMIMLLFKLLAQTGGFHPLVHDLAEDLKKPFQELTKFRSSLTEDCKNA